VITCDTNIVFPGLEASHPDHVEARKFLEGKSNDEEFCLCELVLMEVYTLLRNPVTSRSPLSAAEATRKIQNLRENPAWGLLDYPGTLMNKVWKERPELKSTGGFTM
jgi:predicted nucleic acid-binding protein